MTCAGERRECWRDTLVSPVSLRHDPRPHRRSRRSVAALLRARVGTSSARGVARRRSPAAAHDSGRAAASRVPPPYDVDGYAPVVLTRGRPRECAGSSFTSRPGRSARAPHAAHLSGARRDRVELSRSGAFRARAACRLRRVRPRQRGRAWSSGRGGGEAASGKVTPAQCPSGRCSSVDRLRSTAELSTRAPRGGPPRAVRLSADVMRQRARGDSPSLPSPGPASSGRRKRTPTVGRRCVRIGRCCHRAVDVRHAAVPSELQCTIVVHSAGRVASAVLEVGRRLRPSKSEPPVSGASGNFTGRQSRCER